MSRARPSLHLSLLRFLRMFIGDPAKPSPWIAEKSYPFAADDKSPEREAFDEGVADMRSHLDSFDSLPPSERTYLFSLLRRSIGGRA